MADGQNTVPVPPGAVMGQPMPQTVPVPAGATMGQPVDSTKQTTSEGATGAEGVLSGIGGGVIGTAAGAEKLLNKVLPAGAQLPEIPKEYYEERTPSEKAGGVLEDVGEFVAGDAALEGLARASKMVKLARQVPLVADTLKLAKEHPVLAKIITEGAKAGAVGGAQGAVKGATEGKAGEEALHGAEGGAIGGALGSTVIEAATPLAREVGKALGVGTEAGEDIARGVRPGKRNYRFASDFLRAAPLMDTENSINPAKTVEEWADKTQDAREKLYQNEIKPLVDKWGTEPLGGLNIANGIRANIPKAMTQYSPAEAAKMEELANMFLPGQKFQLQIGDAEEALQHFNAELAATGFWSKMPAEREALLKTNGTIAGLKAAGDSIRDELYGRLDALEPGSGVAELKKTYGALRNVEDEIRGRINVNNRQVPISLKETIGLITGLGHGGPVGAAMAGIPILDRIYNAPEKLITRGVEKAVGKEGAMAGAAKATAGAVGGAVPTLTGAGGAAAGRTLPELMPGWVRVSDSNQNVHDIPMENLGRLQVRDPGIKILASEPPLKVEE